MAGEMETTVDTDSCAALVSSSPLQVMNTEMVETNNTDTVETNNTEEEDENDEEEEEEEDEEEEEEEEEEGEEDVEDEEYTLRFEGEMNPLDFTENDVFGAQPYQQFERLEYEALAQKKRKALNDRSRDGSTKKSRQDDALLANIDEIMEGMNYGMCRRSRKSKRRRRRGRGRKGSKRKLSPEVTKKLGEANFYYAKRQHEEAIHVLKEVVMLAPNLSETYHTLGLVYEEIGDKEKAINFYMLAAHLAPKDHPSLWRWLVTLSIEQGNTGQATHCLNKAILADPEDIGLRYHRAALHIELGEYQKAAETYHYIVGLQPENAEALKMAAEMYRKSNLVEQSINILEEYINDHSAKEDISVVKLLVSIHMENGSYVNALQQIEHVRTVIYNNKQFPMYLSVMEGICKVHLGNLQDAEILFNDLWTSHSEDVADLIAEVADTFMKLGHHKIGLKYFLMIEGSKEQEKGSLHLKIAQCYLSLMEREKAIKFYYQAVCAVEDNVDARLTLASLLLEDGKEDEAITLLSPSKDKESNINTFTGQSKPWWVSGKIVMRLAKIYHARGMTEDFVDSILPCITETLSIESLNLKVKRRKKLSQSILSQRAKLLEDHQVGSVFRGYRPIAAPLELQKAMRAKKSLEKKAALKEEQRAAQLAAGLDGYSDDSDEESLGAPTEPPLPKLLKENEDFQIILDLCKALASLERYWDAMKIISCTLRLPCSTISLEKKEELKLLGAQIAYRTEDPVYAYDYARESVKQHPYSFTAWNRYYEVISRLENRLSKHSKLLIRLRAKHKECVPPMIISGHQLTMISQHQAAAREYLEAYKQQPENPLVNLCAGTALINLALGFRLHNKHQCVAQAFAFLHNNLSLCENSQEALYNFARACQHVGLVTLAVSYYEKVLATCENDYPVPKVSNKEATHPETCKPGYCDLRKEAAYNLHLIYKKSGALDLARQVLRDHCTP